MVLLLRDRTEGREREGRGEVQKGRERGGVRRKGMKGEGRWYAPPMKNFYLRRHCRHIHCLLGSDVDGVA